MGMRWKRSKWQEISRDETVISKDSVTGISKRYSGDSDLKKSDKTGEFMAGIVKEKKSYKDRFVIDYRSLKYLVEKM